MAMARRVLLAEDNDDAAEVVTLVLRALGYTVVVAKNGAEAVESAISWQPDIVVLDMMMPVMDGFQAATKLRQHSKTQTVPILAATALTSSDNRHRCLKSGCDDYIAKPYTPRELAAAIESLLQKRCADEGHPQ